jgi:hypothetical protein
MTNGVLLINTCHEKKECVALGVQVYYTIQMYKSIRVRALPILFYYNLSRICKDGIDSSLIEN